jgi:CheY-like chemotaxis protein
MLTGALARREYRRIIGEARQVYGDPLVSIALLRGHRILVVEDNSTHARQFVDLLRDAGAVVVGPAETVEAAARLIDTEDLSAAWLDVWLNDDGSVKVWPVATLLARKGIPFLFCTNSPNDAELAFWPDRPIFTKPLLSKRSKDAILANLAKLVAVAA